jgi:hypothetical protein
LICAGQNSQLQATTNSPALIYSYSSISYAPVSGSFSAVPGTACDDCSGNVPLPFTFNFYGTNYSSVWVSSNGHVRFDASSTSFGNTALPSSTILNSIAVAWDDLNASTTGTITYGVVGASPNQIFVVNYNGVPHFASTTQFLTAQLLLYEGTNVIEIHTTSSNLPDFTQGVNLNSSLATAVPGRNPAAALTLTNDAVRFTPGPGTSYSWTFDPTLSALNISNPVATAVPATTTYTVTVTNLATGCSSVPATATVTTGIPSPMAPSIEATLATVCAGQQPTTMTALPNGGCPPYTFEWQPGGATTDVYTVAPSVTTTYTVTITDNNGDSETATQTINVNELPPVMVDITSASICLPSTETFHVTASGADSYVWSPLTELVVDGTDPSGGTVDITPTIGRTYTVTGTDGNGCFATATFAVTSNSRPNVFVTSSISEICDGGSATLTASSVAGYGVSSIPYAAVAAPSNPGPSGDDAVMSAVPIGFTFTFYGIPHTTCTISTNGNIQFSSSSTDFSPDAIPNTNIINDFVGAPWCDLNTNQGGNITYGNTTIGANQAFVVSWNSVGFFSGGGLCDMQIILLDDNTVQVHVNSITNTTSNKVLGIESPDGSTGTAAPGRNLGTWSISTPEAWQFAVNPPPQFTWNPGGSNDASITVSPSSTQTYTVTADDGTCTNEATVTVNVSTTGLSSAVPVAVASPATVCPGGNSTLSVSTANVAAIPYAPAVCQSNPGPSGDDAVLSGVAIGFPFTFFGNTYTTCAISTNGNVQFSSASTDFSPDAIPNSAIINDFVGAPWCDLNTNNGGNITYGNTTMGSLTAFVVCYNNVAFFSGGGVCDMQIILLSNNTVQIHVNQVTNSTSNKVLGIENATGTIGYAPPGRNLGTWSITTPEAWMFIPSNGSIPIASAVWSTGGTDLTEVVNPEVTTTYSVIITDEGNCSASTTVDVNVLIEDPSFHANDLFGTGEDFAFEGSQLCVAGNPVQLIPTIPGGTFSGPGVGYDEGSSAWYFDPTGSIFVSPPAVIGENTVTYSLQCQSQSETTTVQAVPVVTLDAFAPVCQHDAPIELGGGIPEGGSYEVDGVPVSVFDPSQYSPGPHTVSYFYQSIPFCAGFATQTIIVNENPTATAIPGTTSLACYTGTTNVTVSATGGMPPYAGTGVFPVGPGSYSFTVTDANGCSDTKSVTITSPPQLEATCTVTNDYLFFGYTGDQTSTVTGTGSGGVGPYTVSITMDRPKLCNQVNDAGDEVWNPAPGGTTINNASCPAYPNPGTLIPVSSKNSTTSYSVTVTLIDTAVFTITVTDANGCTATCTKTIYAMDARCFAGNSGIQKVKVCHKTGSTKNPCVTICVDDNAVETHLSGNPGDKLGDCKIVGCTSKQDEEVVFDQSEDRLLIYPNPNAGVFVIDLETALPDGEADVQILNMVGQVIYSIKSSVFNGALEQEIKFGTDVSAGTYFVRVLTGDKVFNGQIIYQK